ncbi:MAG: hypothetical protein HC850_10150 [Rhodomicrobium sp.]|nr:hypothetical protein [Rhodomicrobium sp.]
MKSWRKVPWLPIQQAIEEIGKLTADISIEKDPRKRVKLARRLAFAGSSLAFSKEALDTATVEIGIAALQTSRRNGAVTDDLNRSIAWLSKLRLEVSGSGSFEVLAEKKKIIATDSACLAATGQTDLDVDIWTKGIETIFPAMNRGDFFLVTTGYDGRYPVILRITNAPEPVLKAAEYKYLECSTDIGVVAITNSVLIFGAPENIREAACVPALNGYLLVQLHYLSMPRGERFVLTGCSTKETSGNFDKFRKSIRSSEIRTEIIHA